MALALLVASTPAKPVIAGPYPEGGASVVVMGDSYAANGDVASAMVAAQGLTKECRHSLTSWPTQLAQLLGSWYRRDLGDSLCLGASLITGPGYTLSQETKGAHESGALGPRTRVVAIQLGINDAWGANSATIFKSWMSCLPDFRDGCDPDAALQGRSPDYRGITGQDYADRISQVVEYIRYYAPDARIVLVGYPELNSPGQRSWCVDVAGLARINQRRAGAVTEYMDRLDVAQREAAHILHLDFFDTRALTAGHGLCSSETWLNGLLVPNRELFGIPFHPTIGGDLVLARALQEWIIHSTPTTSLWSRSGS